MDTVFYQGVKSTVANQILLVMLYAIPIYQVFCTEVEQKTVLQLDIVVHLVR